MKTDAKTMAEVLRKAADNLESGINVNDQIQVKYGGNDWSDREGNSLYFNLDGLYRIKPKTIVVNGVEIPRPLDVSELNLSKGGVYSPSAHFRLFHNEDAEIAYRNFSLNDIYYSTRQEAIEASKKLFGIE